MGHRRRRGRDIYGGRDGDRYDDYRDNGSGSAMVLSILIVVGRLLVSVVIIITRSVIIGITWLV